MAHIDAETQTVHYGYVSTHKVLPDRVVAILYEVGRENGVTIGDMLSRMGPWQIRRIRGLAWKRMRDEIVICGKAVSYPQIGKWVGHDHTTVMSACGARKNRRRT